MKKIILASTSTLFGEEYLEYPMEELAVFFKDVMVITFIPYARPGGISHDDYTELVANAFSKIDKKVVGLHTFSNPTEAINQAEAIYTGGGNTFLLVHQLYRSDLMQPLKEKIIGGTPYLGTSAGSNICGVTMMNTNDMPIVYPPSFNTLGFIPFNINAHYLDPIDGSTHMGETRATRIKEYHAYNSITVLGLREGSWLQVSGASITLKGKLTARVFKQDQEPYEIESGSEVAL
ncbi:MAG: dipeptidase PepE [Flavobacteriaceae bacterium]|nr:dipeptidase PepE [Flavobacteriaceae bacterium]